MDKILPSDVEAERAVLGSMLFGTDAVMIAVESIKAEDFYAPANKIVFETMIELFTKNIPVDIVTLKSKLDDKGVTDAIGGKEFLIRLASEVSTWANMRDYIKIVENKSILRKIIRIANELSGKSYAQTDSVSHIIDFAEKEIFNIIQSKGSADFSHIHDIVADAVALIEEASKTKNQITGISTGFTDFDTKTSGLQKKDLILLAARPSMGKTAFALNIASNAAIKNNIPTAIFSLEMSKEQLVNRIIASESMIDSLKLKTGQMEHADWSRLAKSLGAVASAPIYINDSTDITATEIRAKCRKLKLEKGLGLVLIDYLQLMTAGGKPESRQLEISEISRSLKSLARELEVPVITLSQLSRACEARADKRPMLSDLRESGAIEQDADVVAFLYRDEYYNPDTETPNQAELIIAKQRNGPTGTVDLAWLSKYTKFSNLLVQ